METLIVLICCIALHQDDAGKICESILFDKFSGKIEGKIKIAKEITQVS